MHRLRTGSIRFLARTAVVAGIALLPAGCLTTSSDLSVIQADINNLKKDAYQRKKSLAAVEEKLRSLERDLRETAAQTESIPSGDAVAALRQSQTSLYSQVSDLLREVQDLRGQTEEASYGVDRRLKDLAAEVEVLKSGTAGTADTAAPEGDVQRLAQRVAGAEQEIVLLKGRLLALETKAREARVVTPQGLYDDALATFNAKKYVEARGKWKAFLKDYSGHKLAGNAQFWIGETHYAEQDYDDAILAYQEVLDKHSDSPKVPAALLKQAYAFQQLGDKKAARGILRVLIEKFPDASETDAAKRKLETLK